MADPSKKKSLPSCRFAGLLARVQRVRVIFWVHFALALYSLTCGMLDASNRHQEWMILNGPVFWSLALSAFTLPLVAWKIALHAGVPRQGLLSVSHAAMTVAQLFGLLFWIS
jgi:hypothetical protein